MDYGLCAPWAWTLAHQPTPPKYLRSSTRFLTMLRASSQLGSARAISHCVTCHIHQHVIHQPTAPAAWAAHYLGGFRGRFPPSCVSPSRHNSRHCTRPALMFPALTLVDRPYPAVPGLTRPNSAKLGQTWPYPVVALDASTSRCHIEIRNEAPAAAAFRRSHFCSFVFVGLYM